MARAASTFNFNAFLGKEKLKTSGSNLTAWYCNLRIILTAANMYVLEAPLGPTPVPASCVDEVSIWQWRSEDHTVVQCAMLYSMEPELQKHYEHTGAY
jgi:hypothetical protein